MESILSQVPSIIGISYLFLVSAGFAFRVIGPAPVLDPPDRQREQKFRSDPPDVIRSNDISSLSGLGAAGTAAEVLRKRHLQNQEEEPPAKRQKKYEDDFICPINLNLPLDPVTAADGHIYEREAIEHHIKNNRGGKLVSPISRKKMGKKLMATLTIKNTIEKMVENGDITGELAEDWKRQVKQKKDMEDWLKREEEWEEELSWLEGLLD